MNFILPRTPDHAQLFNAARETRLKAGPRKPLLAYWVWSGVKIVMQVYGTVVFNSVGCVYSTGTGTQVRVPAPYICMGVDAHAQ